jgi:hypothetical protein
LGCNEFVFGEELVGRLPKDAAETVKHLTGVFDACSCRTHTDVEVILSHTGPIEIRIAFRAGKALPGVVDRDDGA